MEFLFLQPQQAEATAACRGAKMGGHGLKLAVLQHRKQLLNSGSAQLTAR